MPGLHHKKRKMTANYKSARGDKSNRLLDLVHLAFMGTSKYAFKWRIIEYFLTVHDGYWHHIDLFFLHSYWMAWFHSKNSKPRQRPKLNRKSSKSFVTEVKSSMRMQPGHSTRRRHSERTCFPLIT